MHEVVPCLVPEIEEPPSPYGEARGEEEAARNLENSVSFPPAGLALGRPIRAGADLPSGAERHNTVVRA